MPPETTRAPALGERLGQRPRRSRRSAAGRAGTPRSAASLKATALPAMTCISGPPWTPGKTVLSIGARRASALTLGKSAGSTLGGQLVAAEDQPAARPAERLVGRRRDDVGVRERAGVDAGRDEAGDVGHVDEQQRPDAVGDRRHPLEVDDPRVGAGAGDDQLRPDLAGLGLERVVVDALGVLADAVGVDLVQPAAEVERHAVGQVAAVGEVHARGSGRPAASTLK